MAAPTNQTSQANQPALPPHEEILERCLNIINALHDFVTNSETIDWRSIIPLQAKASELKSAAEELRSSLKSGSFQLTREEKKGCQELLQRMRDLRKTLRERAINPVLKQERRLLKLSALVRCSAECEDLRALFETEYGLLGWELLHGGGCAGGVGDKGESGEPKDKTK
jgi:hypothetical protein